MKNTRCHKSLASGQLFLNPSKARTGGGRVGATWRSFYVDWPTVGRDSLLPPGSVVVAPLKHLMWLRVRRLHLMPQRQFNQGEQRAHEAPALPTLPSSSRSLSLLVLLWHKEQTGEMRNISCESNFFASKSQRHESRNNRRRRTTKEEERLWVRQ